MTTTADGAVAKKSKSGAVLSDHVHQARGFLPAGPRGRPRRWSVESRGPGGPGKEARAVAPLESHAEFSPRAGRDPVGLLLGQAASRVPELVPVRHGRMLVSPFTFYRGAALPMAADLAGTPRRGCG